ncbi:MAG: DUF3187 family protein [Steroidobacter sp.]
MNAAPLPIRDLNPFLTGFELPPALPSDSDHHRNDLDISYAISNISLDQQAGDEHVIADAELHRWQLTLTHDINPHWNIQVELPYQSISGGSFDSFLENFHNDFNLPNGNRASWPRNRLLIDYSVANQSLYQLDTSQSGLGDLALRAGWHFDSHQSHSTSLWLNAKFPTGSANNLMGSGSLDAAVTLAAEQSIGDDIHSFEQISMSWLGNGKRLPDEQRHSAWSGILGVDWTLTHAIDVIAQLDSHSGVYDSGIRMLGTATQLAIGPRYHSTHWQEALSITEDIATDTAPDVQFQFNLGYRF